MKKTLSVLVVLMVVSSVVFARRMDNPGTSSSSAAVVKTGNTFKLYYKGSEQDDVKVSIHDASGRIVFSETIKDIEGFVRPYNFAHLPEGDYSIKVTDRSGRQIQKISYKHEKAEPLAHLLKVSGSNAKYLLTVSNQADGDVTVKIYDGSNNIIYNKKEPASKEFAKIYNLEGIAGQFTFEVTDQKGTYTSLHR